MILANIFQPLISVFESVLQFFHDSIGASWGLSIIMLTIAVRCLLLPLAVKQFRSMRALQRIAPQLKVLQVKYKEDKPRLQQETMAFYKEHKVNPLASCLPLAFQLPVFLSLFYMLRHDLRIDICGQAAKPCGDVGHPEKFFFIHDITGPATGGTLITLIVLYAGSQLLSSLLMMTPTTDKNQRMIMLFLPVVFIPFVYKFPAGLLCYWITTNFWTILQQQFLKRVIGRNEPPMPDPPPKVEGEENDGGFLGRLMGSATPARPVTVPALDGGGGRDSRVTKAPPPPPRQRKRKRSGRRR